MAHQLISVCIFCFICATHSPCASHASVGRIDQYRHDGYKDPNIPKLENNPLLNVRKKYISNPVSGSFNDDDQNAQLKNDNSHMILKRTVAGDALDVSNDFLKKIFFKYGDGDVMTVVGFEKLLKRLDILQMVAEKLGEDADEVLPSDARKEAREVLEHNETCFNDKTIAVLQETTRQDPLNHTTFSEACPLLIYSLLAEPCHNAENEVFDVLNSKAVGVDGWIWLYSSLAVLVISVCGVGALAIIPITQKKFYNPLIQFLVALAIGSLAGDAFLHLMPHAMGGSHSHGHGHQDSDHDEHLMNTLLGLATMLGLIFFFIMERLISVVVKMQKKKQKHQTLAHTHLKVYNDKGERRNSTQCMDKYNTSPYCYKDIMTDTCSHSDLKAKHSRSPTLPKLEGNHSVAEANLISTPCIDSKISPHDHEDFTVIVREHANEHHGHSHKHGHVHSAPQNYSSVAWMVIMGDGLHNFTDGMAIGAAFASGIAGGFSTTVAVFCHELPHELGDFAMLLKAGMSIKQALFYNLLSSALCILGNLVGLYLGNTETANRWLFAVAAGTFVYIALVDMMPELSSSHDDESNLVQCFLHLSGLLLGVGIMACIAMYEPQLKHLFHEET